MSDDILNFLIKCELQNKTNEDGKSYAEVFKKIGLDSVKDIMDLEEDDIKEMKFKRLHIKKFLRVVKETKSKLGEESKESEPEPGSVNYTQRSNKYRGPKKKAALLFIGETGVGKSTLLDSLRDYLNGVNFDDVKHTKKTNNTGKSETQEVKQECLSNDKFAVTIIDTPGLGDTDGVDKDNKHMGNIINFLGDFGDFNAVCILLKRGSCRSTHRLKYIVNEFRMNMPKDVQDNFIVIFTRCEVPTIDQDSLNVVKELKLPVKNIIPVNNIAYEEQATDKELRNGMYEKMVKNKQKMEYYANHQFLEMLIEEASKMKLYQGDKIKKLKQKRDKLKESVSLLKSKLDASFRKDQEITDKVAALDDMIKLKSKNVKWDVKRPTTKENWVSSGRIDTACMTCSRICHHGCGLSYGDDLNSCSCAGSNNRCGQCSHPMHFHEHRGWTKTSNVVYEYMFPEDVRRKMKNDLDNATEKHKAIKQQKLKLEKEKRDLERDRKKLVSNIQKSYKELSQMAIIGHNESYSEYLLECKKAIVEDTTMPTKKKDQMLNFYNTAIDKAKLFLDTIKNVLRPW